MNLFIVSGSRDLRETHKAPVIDRIQIASLGLADVVIMHGACGADAGKPMPLMSCMKGADLFAHHFAKNSHIPVLPMPAPWSRLGPRAGMARNGRMVRLAKAMEDCGWTVRLLAFPMGASPGTRNMIRQCQQAGFRVDVYEVAP